MKRVLPLCLDDLKKKYFTKVGSSYQISDEIKKRVEFKKHDLLKDPYPSGCNLIVCRNVVIYFTEEAKDVIYQKFHKALQPGGVLFIGQYRTDHELQRTWIRQTYIFSSLRKSKICA